MAQFSVTLSKDLFNVTHAQRIINAMVLFQVNYPSTRLTMLVARELIDWTTVCGACNHYHGNQKATVFSFPVTFTGAEEIDLLIQALERLRDNRIAQTICNTALKYLIRESFNNSDAKGVLQQIMKRSGKTGRLWISKLLEEVADEDNDRHHNTLLRDVLGGAGVIVIDMDELPPFRHR